MLSFKGKQFEPEPKPKYEIKGSLMITEVTGEKGEKKRIVEELKCLPAATDPRPRFKE